MFFKVLQLSPVSIIPPPLGIHLASTRCSQHKEKRAKPGKLSKVSGLSEMGERWVEEYVNITVYCSNVGRRVR